MNNLFDTLILRFLFAFLILLMIYLYRYIIVFFYPDNKAQLTTQFFPDKNIADTIHLFSRVIGLSLVFSEFSFNLNHGLWFGIMDLIIGSIVVYITFLGSIFIAESIVLYNFEYQDEVKKRHNTAYALISGILAICVGMMIKTSLSVASHSIILYAFSWLFSLVLFGFACKAYHYITRLPTNLLVIKKNIAAAISFGGFIFGWTWLIVRAMPSNTNDLLMFILEAAQQLLIAIIFWKIVIFALEKIFKIQKASTGQTTKDDEYLGFALHEGTIFIAASFLTAIL